VDFLEYAANSVPFIRMLVNHRVGKKNYVLEASVAMRSKMSLTKEFKIAIALLEIPVSGCTCFSTNPFEFTNAIKLRPKSTHLCKCKTSTSPCGPCDASSFPQGHQQMAWKRFSSQPLCPQSIWQEPWRLSRREPCQRWKRVWGPLDVRGAVCVDREAKMQRGCWW